MGIILFLPAMTDLPLVIIFSILISDELGRLVEGGGETRTIVALGSEQLTPCRRRAHFLQHGQYWRQRR